jgi:hypothetical protein
MRADNLFRRLLNTARSVDAPPTLIESLVAIYQEYRTTLVFTPPAEMPALDDEVIKQLATACVLHVAACKDKNSVWANTVNTWAIGNLTPAPKPMPETEAWCSWCCRCCRRRAKS